MRHSSPESMEKILAFTDSYYARHRKSPTCRDIAAGIGLGVTTVHRYLHSMTEKKMLEYNGQTITTPKIRDMRDGMTRVGIVGGVSCGLPTEPNPVFEEYLTLPDCLAGKGEVYILYAEGDSMIGAGIFSGDMVIVRRAEEARTGEIVVAWVEGEGATLKRLISLRDGKVFLHPENPKYADIPAENMKIQGIAVKVIRDL